MSLAADQSICSATIPVPVTVSSLIRIWREKKNIFPFGFCFVYTIATASAFPERNGYYCITNSFRWNFQRIIKPFIVGNHAFRSFGSNAPSTRANRLRNCAMQIEYEWEQNMRVNIRTFCCNNWQRVKYPPKIVSHDLPRIWTRTKIVIPSPLHLVPQVFMFALSLGVRQHYFRCCAVVAGVINVVPRPSSLLTARNLGSRRANENETEWTNRVTLHKINSNFRSGSSVWVCEWIASIRLFHLSPQGIRSAAHARENSSIRFAHKQLHVQLDQRSTCVACSAWSWMQSCRRWAPVSLN